MGSKTVGPRRFVTAAEVSAKLASFGYMNMKLFPQIITNLKIVITRPHVAPHGPEYNPYKLYVGLR